MKFLFWNIKDNDAAIQVLAQGLDGEAIDVVVLAECRNCLAADESPFGDAFKKVDTGPPSRLVVWHRIATTDIQPIFDGTDSRFRIDKIIGTFPLLFVSAHFPSKLNAGTYDHNLHASDLIHTLEDAEDKHNTTSSIIVGDLNMNPFDPPVVSAGYLHAFMSVDAVQGGSRIVGNKKYRTFYNPMWSLLGDRTPGPPGSHFYIDGAQSTHWHLIDQVLVRPELAPRLGFVRVLDRLDQMKLCSTNGRPSVSDHFPLVFELDLRTAERP